MISGVNKKYSANVLNFDTLEEIVEHDSKKRYSFSEYFTKIRANQGHSIPIDLGLNPIEPPSVLYHGTASRFVMCIKEKGINKMSRNHVHLSDNMETALAVGSRHGSPFVLIIDSKKMYEDGISFCMSENGVWLTDFVDLKYITNLPQGVSYE